MNRWVFRKKSVSIAGVVLLLLIGLGIWLFRPFPPSPYQSLPTREGYLNWTVRPSSLTGPPFHDILSGLGYPLPRIPGAFNFLLPSTLTFTLQEEKSAIGPGWTLSTHLGWRARLLTPFTGLIQQRIEGQVYLFRDQGTLFVSPHPYFLEDLQAKKGGKTVLGEHDDKLPSNLLMVLSASNRTREITRSVERFQSGTQFLIFPSIDSLDSLLLRITYRDRTTLQGEITLWVRESGSMESVQGDMEYLLDLLERTMSTGGVGLTSKLRSEGKVINVDLILSHADRLERVPWNQLKEAF